MRIVHLSIRCLPTRTCRACRRCRRADGAMSAKALAETISGNAVAGNAGRWRPLSDRSFMSLAFAVLATTKRQLRAESSTSTQSP